MSTANIRIIYDDKTKAVEVSIAGDKGTNALAMAKEIMDEFSKKQEGFAGKYKTTDH